MRNSTLIPLLALLLLSGHLSIAQVPDTTVAEQFYRKGQEYMEARNYDSAYLNFLEAEKIYEKTEFKERYGEMIYYVGLSRHYKYDDEFAMSCYQRCLEIFKGIKPRVDPMMADIMNNMGSVYINTGYRFKAKKYLDEALEIGEILYGLDSIETAVTQYNYGLLCMYFGEYPTALKHFMNAYPSYLRRYGANGSRVAQLYTNVGILHQHNGDYDLAMDYFNKGVAIHMENHGPGYWNLAYPYSTMAGVYSDLGDYDKSLDYYTQALELCESNRGRLVRLESNIHGNLGRLYLRMKNHEKSLWHYDQAIKIMIDAFHDQHSRLADFYGGKGDVYLDQENYDMAEEFYAKARGIMQNNFGDVHPKLAAAYYRQARMYRNLEDYDRSLNLVQEGYKAVSTDFTSDDLEQMPTIESALDIKQLLFLTLMKASVFKARGMANESAEDLEQAIAQYEIVSTIIDRIRRGFLSESSKLFIQENFISIYENAIETCYQLYALEADPKYLESAFHFIEKSKSTVLSEALQVADLHTIQGIPSEIQNKEKDLTGYIRSLELKLSNAQLTEGDSLQKALQNELFSNKTSLDSLARVIEEEYPNYYNLKYNQEVVSASNVMQGLDENTLVITFFEGDSTWYLLSMGQDKMFLDKVEKTRVSKDQIEQFRLSVSQPSSTPEEFGAPGYVIYDQLLRATLEQFNQPERLIIVPSGPLGYIPFDALVSKPVKNGESPEYLIRNHVISYASSLTLISQSQEQKSSFKQPYIGFAPDYPEQFTAFANTSSELYRDELTRLVGTKEEVSYAGEIFKGTTYLDQEATEENFKNLLSSPAILHLAMHALLNDEDPMRSQLIFSYQSDTVEDGRLNAYEIYNLKIGSELAVLSACNTGVGKINKGEGVMSLSRAFMYAGCPNIVMSLWRAKDQPSAQIISNFFKNLKNQLPKDEALRQAKLDYLSSADPLKSHPANWATFVLLGDSEPIRTGTPWISWIGGLAILLLGTGFYYFRRKQKANA